MADLPEIAEIQWLTAKPGDRIIVRVPTHIDRDQAARLMRGLAAWLPDGVPVMILSGGTTLEVAEADV